MTMLSLDGLVFGIINISAWIQGAPARRPVPGHSPAARTSSSQSFSLGRRRAPPPSHTPQSATSAPCLWTRPTGRAPSQPSPLPPTRGARLRGLELGCRCFQPLCTAVALCCSPSVRTHRRCRLNLRRLPQSPPQPQLPAGRSVLVCNPLHDGYVHGPGRARHEPAHHHQRVQRRPRAPGRGHHAPGRRRCLPAGVPGEGPRRVGDGVLALQQVATRACALPRQVLLLSCAANTVPWRARTHPPSSPSPHQLAALDGRDCVWLR